jgi:cation:H+ antiporter
MVIYYIIFFIACCAALYLAGNWVVGGLSRIAKFLEWKEFTAAFFIMAMAATLPNLFLAIMSVINGVPELSLGDVMGGNVVDMTLTIALAAFFSKKGIDAKSQTVQTSLGFTFIAAILPLLLLLDGSLSRIDGAVLLAFFCSYVYWLLSKKERFKVVYNSRNVTIGKQFGRFTKDLLKVVAGVAVMMAVAQGIVSSASAFSADFNVALPLVGILIIGLGNSFPEIYFSIVSARANKTKLILGDLMGAIILPGTLVLGMVALISPIKISGVAMFAAARYFLLAAAVFFYICVKSGQKVTKKEAVLLLSIYIVFLLTEILAK